MFILNYIFGFFLTTSSSIKAFFTQPRSQREEETPLLLSERHLSSNFVLFEESYGVVYAALWHTIFYYVITVILFSYVVEDFSVIDSLYFASTVFTTVGYGDMSPTNNASRIAVIVLAFYGITILGLFLGMYGSAIVESNEQAVQRSRKKLREKMVRDRDESQGDTSSSGPRDKETSFLGDILNILFLQGPLLIILVVVGQIVGYLEGWDVVESLYWTVITSTSIGFGDDAPTLSITRLVGVFFLPFAVAVFGEFLGRVAGTYVERKQRRSEKKFLDQAMTLADLQEMDVDHDGNVDKAEFLSFMLVTLQRVDQEDIDTLWSLFRRLDTDGSGHLNAADLKARASERLQIPSIVR